MTDRPDQPDDDRLERIAERLDGVSAQATDRDELRLVLARFPAVDTELEALRLCQRIGPGEHLRFPAKMLERWLEKARPSEPLATVDSGRDRGRLSETEIARRVAHRRDLYGRAMEYKGPVALGTGPDNYGPVFTDAELEAECAEYEAALRAGRAR